MATNIYIQLQSGELSETNMTTSSNGNIFCFTGHLGGEFTDHRWFPRAKASDAEFDVFFDLRLNKRLSKQRWGWWFETSSRPLWRHCNEMKKAKWEAFRKDLGVTKCAWDKLRSMVAAAIHQ